MDDTKLCDRLRPDLADRVGQPFETVADDDAHVVHAAVADLGEHAQPVLRAFAAVAGPQAKDVASTIDGHGQGDVDGPVRDLPVTDLDVDAVDEHDRVDRVE